jgi:hypothetical protein
VPPIDSERAERYDNGPDSIAAWLPSVCALTVGLLFQLLRQLIKDAHRLTDGSRVHLHLLSPVSLVGYPLDDAMMLPEQLQYSEKGLFTEARRTKIPGSPYAGSRINQNPGAAIPAQSLNHAASLGTTSALIFLPQRRSSVSSMPKTSGPSGTNASRSNRRRMRLASRLDQLALL